MSMMTLSYPTNMQTLDVLKPFHEEWSGIPLTGALAYGLRIYRNDTHLNMHVDKANTHIISCILHVDHDDDPESEPWPIVIEDFQGNTNEVVLESGDMLFYESSKLLHGRPRRFKGKWYSSIFVHYHPPDWNVSKGFDQHDGCLIIRLCLLILRPPDRFLCEFLVKICRLTNVFLNSITVCLHIGTGIHPKMKNWK